MNAIAYTAQETRDLVGSFNGVKSIYSMPSAGCIAIECDSEANAQKASTALSTNQFLVSPVMHLSGSDCWSFGVMPS